MESDNIFAEKLNEAISRFENLHGRKLTDNEIAGGLEGKTTPGHVGKLRRGQIKNPQYTMIAAIARFFELPISFFFDEADAEPETLELAKRLENNPGAQKIALRATDDLTSDVEQQMVLRMMDEIVKLRKDREDDQS